MKKIITCFMALMLIAGCSQPSVEVNPDAAKFKEEYEILNGTMSEYGDSFMEMNIVENNTVTYADIDKIMEILDTEGVIYFGFPECPWCRNAVPVLIEAAIEEELPIYYFNAKPFRDTLNLEDGEIKVEKEKDPEYQKLYDKLYEVLPVYDGLNDETIKRLYFPTVVFVKDGKVINFHESTVTAQEDPAVALTSEQAKELKDIYVSGMKDVKKAFCDIKC